MASSVLAGEVSWVSVKLVLLRCVQVSQVGVWQASYVEVRSV